MSGHAAMNSTTVFLEIGATSLRALIDGHAREWPLDRDEAGLLTDSCRARLQHDLGEALARGRWQSKRPAWCAVSGRGVSLRRLTLPRVSGAELRRLIGLQIESEFPVPPDQLAWGCLPLGEAVSGNGAAAAQEVLVAAVRKTVLEDYTTLFDACGLAPAFTLAGQARHALCLPAGGVYSTLHLDGQEAEWVGFRDGFPTRLRVLPLAPSAAGVAEPAGAEPAEMTALLDALPRTGLGRSVHLSGGGPQREAWLAFLRAKLGSDIQFQVLDSRASDGLSPALAGLRQVGGEADARLLFLDTAAVDGITPAARHAPWKWVILALILLVAWAAVPYVEAWMFRSRLASQLTELKKHEPKLAMIDRQLGFLRYLKNGQPPYLDTLTLLTKVLPPGAKVESLNLNRRGELALRVTVRQPQEAADFRSKLVDSGFFASVVVEEQAPSADRQKVALRLSAQLKSAGAREGLPLLAEPTDTNANAKAKSGPTK